MSLYSYRLTDPGGRTFVGLGNYLVTPWLADALRATITETVGAPPSWVLSNHDVARYVSRSAGDSGPGDGDMRWEDAPDGVLSFSREPGFQCLVNISDGPIAIAAGTEVLLVSDGVTGGVLPVDTAVWLRSRR
ncbi:hypothetical protein [Nocardia terpenica]|uniref:hypothetical protein n=1 Tax=Nocardia terpenica TaxID=455432 RepID=UPI0018851E27|nr:hypothetical protein [Nocardia terpenica]